MMKNLLNWLRTPGYFSMRMVNSIDKNKKIFSWSFLLNGQSHVVDLHVWTSSGKREIIIDGSIAFKQKFIMLRKDKTYKFPIDGEKAVIDINDTLPDLNTRENDMLRYDCYINGRSLNFGTAPKNKEEKLIEKTRQDKKAWEQIQSRGLTRYLLKELDFFIPFLIVWIIILLVVGRWDTLLLISIGSASIGLLIVQLSSSIMDWRKNCKRYVKNQDLRK